MTTMIQADDPTLHVGMVDATVWAEAVEHLRGDAIPGGDPDRLALWQAAGIITDGGPDPLWRRALVIAQTSLRGCRIVSRFGDVVFEAAVLVAAERDWAICVTSRATVARDDEGAEVVGAVHPMVEVAIAPADRLWRLIRRVLPPLEELRHEPHATRQGSARRLALEGVVIPESMRTAPENLTRHLLQLPDLPRELLNVAEPRAAVFTHTVVADDGAVKALSRTWALGQRLYLVDVGTASVWEVPPGDLGFALVEGLTA
ncbi:hypothetical protein GCM10025789_12270 [Tessaracoccus lubricantis]|uniref:ESX secretion-associated protein EspG n=1 Tax=Tessaracoccus lubricantis TaxID=545543 RepID=A0ABP9FA01_9ACTN